MAINSSEIQRQANRIDIQSENFNTIVWKIMQSLKIIADTASSQDSSFAKNIYNLYDNYNISRRNVKNKCSKLSTIMNSYVRQTISAEQEVSSKVEVFEDQIDAANNSINNNEEEVDISFE